jgi:hypothetical protein
MISIRCVQLKSLYTAVMWILLESYKIHMYTLTFVWIEAHVFDQQRQCSIGSWLDSYTSICTFVEVLMKHGWKWNRTYIVSSGSLVETSTKLPSWLVEVWWKFGWNFNQTSTNFNWSLVEVWLKFGWSLVEVWYVFVFYCVNSYFKLPLKLPLVRVEVWLKLQPHFHQTSTTHVEV